MMRSKTIIAAGLLGLAGTSASADAADRFAEFIAAGIDQTEACSRERAAIEATVERLRTHAFPVEGDFVIVNIPAGELTAYSDGAPVMQMQTIVGTKEHPTPRQRTRVTSVRFNPTWTVPWSIVQEDDWKQKLVEEPDFFRRNRFELRDIDGDLVSIDDASKDPGQVAKFIQAPGRYNALGQFRFNIGSMDSIYLHDTRDRQNFYDGSPIGLSHGCVRVEKPQELASWLLDTGNREISRRIDAGATTDTSLKDPVPIVMGYFTAWPDADGNILIHDDIYELDDPSCETKEGTKL